MSTLSTARVDMQRALAVKHAAQWIETAPKRLQVEIGSA
jgi:hypothetical protein